MKILLTSKFNLFVLLLAIPINFIVISGIGNVYFSTLVIFIQFVFLSIITKGFILTKRIPFYAFTCFTLILVTTFVNIIFDAGEAFQTQMVLGVIYLQNLLVFIVGYYLFERLDIETFFKLFLLIAFFVSIRMMVEDYENLFVFSTVRGERIEAHFAAGVNNFAMLMGIALIISFFYFKKKTLRIGLSIYWLVVILLTMSRGALLGVVVTFFLVACYDTNLKTLRNLLKLSVAIILLGTIFIYYFDKVDFVLAQVQERFFGLLTGDLSFKQFGSGRDLVLGDLYTNHLLNSSLFEFLFGHGMGSIDFMVNGHPYESSHNIFMDILYRNGALFLLLYILFFIHLMLLFFNNRSQKNLALFGIFVFLHLELLVNPFLFAAQIGWVYTFFVAGFLLQNQLSGKLPKNRTLKLDGE